MNSKNTKFLLFWHSSLCNLDSTVDSLGPSNLLTLLPPGWCVQWTLQQGSVHPLFWVTLCCYRNSWGLVDRAPAKVKFSIVDQAQCHFVNFILVPGLFSPHFPHKSWCKHSHGNLLHVASSGFCPESLLFSLCSVPCCNYHLLKICLWAPPWSHTGHMHTAPSTWVFVLFGYHTGISELSSLYFINVKTFLLQVLYLFSHQFRNLEWLFTVSSPWPHMRILMVIAYGEWCQICGL